MTIWILALLIVAGLVYAGFSQGAIRVAFSTLGIFAGFMLALPLSVVTIPLCALVLPLLALPSPWMPYIVGPVLAFYLVGGVFKLLAQWVHRKVEYHYKYNEPDARRALWERMNKRVGACLGTVNALLYVMVVSTLIFVPGYLLMQTGGGESEAFAIRGVTKLAEDLNSTGMHKVAVKLDPAPQKYYEMADFVGLLYNNRPLFQRIGTYPSSIVLANKEPFKGLANDSGFQETLQKERDPLTLVNHAQVMGILTNESALKEVIEFDIPDLSNHLATGKSPKFDPEVILGRWRYDFPASFKEFRDANLLLPSSAMRTVRNEMENRSRGATLTATLDNDFVLQLFGASNTPPRLLLRGKWKKKTDGGYELAVTTSGGSATADAKIEGTRLHATIEGRGAWFVRIPN